MGGYGGTATGSMTRMRRGFLRTYLLHIDSGAALLAGAFVLTFSAWLSRLYLLPRRFVVLIGAANIAYGLFSGSLALRAHRPRSLILALVAGNASWAVLCAIASIAVAGTASAFGLAQLIGEGLFVAWLAALEWREREHLLHRADTRSPA